MAVPFERSVVADFRAQSPIPLALNRWVKTAKCRLAFNSH